MAIEKKTFRMGPYQDYFAEGTQVGNIIYLSGQIAVDEEGNTPEDIVEQTKLAYANMQYVLSQFGADMSNVVDETMFVTSMEEFFADVEAVYTAREEAYGSKPEACQTLLQVSGLALPALKVEIKCTAHL